MHLVGFIIKKFVTMHGHVNVKNDCSLLDAQLLDEMPYNVDELAGTLKCRGFLDCKEVLLQRLSKDCAPWG